VVATALADLPQGRPGKSKSPIGDLIPTQAEAAALLNVSKRSVKSARRVKEDGVPELAAAVVAGDVAVSAALAAGDGGRGAGGPAAWREQEQIQGGANLHLRSDAR